VDQRDGAAEEALRPRSRSDEVRAITCVRDARMPRLTLTDTSASLFLRCFVSLSVQVYSVCAWWGLYQKYRTEYWDLLRETYEAFVIFAFFRYLLGFLGGYKQLVITLARTHPQHHMFPLCCLPSWKMGKSFLDWTMYGCLQYVPVKLTLALLTFALTVASTVKNEEGAAIPTGIYYGNGNFSPMNGYIYIAFFTNASQIWAMYSLVMFYHALRDDLKTIRPIPKFLCIKLVVFATFWQSVLVSGLVYINIVHATATYSVENVSTGIQDFIICIEMLLASIAHIYAFPHLEFEKGSPAWMVATHNYSVAHPALQPHEGGTADVQHGTSSREQSRVTRVTTEIRVQPLPHVVVDRMLLAPTDSTSPMGDDRFTSPSPMAQSAKSGASPKVDREKEESRHESASQFSFQEAPALLRVKSVDEETAHLVHTGTPFSKAGSPHSQAKSGSGLELSPINTPSVTPPQERSSITNTSNTSNNNSAAVQASPSDISVAIYESKMHASRQLSGGAVQPTRLYIGANNISSGSPAHPPTPVFSPSSAGSKTVRRTSNVMRDTT
jgi:hypothetical protein